MLPEYAVGFDALLLSTIIFIISVFSKTANFEIYNVPFYGNGIKPASKH